MASFRLAEFAFRGCRFLAVRIPTELVRFSPGGIGGRPIFSGVVTEGLGWLELVVFQGFGGKLGSFCEIRLGFVFQVWRRLALRREMASFRPRS